MDDVRFDVLVRRCGTGATRRGALRLLGGGVLTGTLLPALAPDAAASRARKRCRRKSGSFLGWGTCHCAVTCGADFSRFSCHETPGCLCLKTANGTGFCGVV